jgi:hypothetical protein
MKGRAVNTKTGRPGTCANYRIVDERKGYFNKTKQKQYF